MRTRTAHGYGTRSFAGDGRTLSLWRNEKKHHEQPAVHPHCMKSPRSGLRRGSGRAGLWFNACRRTAFWCTTRRDRPPIRNRSANPTASSRPRRSQPAASAEVGPTQGDPLAPINLCHKLAWSACGRLGSARGLLHGKMAPSRRLRASLPDTAVATGSEPAGCPMASVAVCHEIMSTLRAQIYP